MKFPLRLESRIALLMGVLLGIPAVLWVPPFVTFDGPDHLLRALQISRGEFRAERFPDGSYGGSLPKGQVEFVNSTLWNYYNKAGLGYQNRSQWQELSAREAAIKGMRSVEFTNTAVYSPANYLFQSLGMGLAGALPPSPILSNGLACVFNLSGYLVLVVCAIECAPRFRRGILLLASSPLMLVQAASLSPDAINFALPLLIVAWVWRLRVRPVKRPVLEIAAVFSLSILASLLKPAVFPVLICVAAVPSDRFGQSRWIKPAVLAGLLLVVGSVWYFWNSAYFSADIARWFDPGRPPISAERAVLLDHPDRFLASLGRLYGRELPALWPHFYGDVGDWISTGSYRVVSALSLAFLLGLLGCSHWQGAPDRAWASCMAAAALCVIAVTALFIWLDFGSPELTSIPSFSGRYLYLPVLGLGVAWSEFFHSRCARLRKLLFGIGLTANALGLCVIILPVAAATH